MRATMDVTTRSQHVHRQGDHQQTGGADVRGLKVPVARPKPSPDCSAGGDGKKKQREQREDPGVFITRGGRLDMLEDPVIDNEQQHYVENRGAEYQPAEKLVAAHCEGTGVVGPRPDRQHAEDEATGDRAETQGLRNLPPCNKRRHGLGRVYTADRRTQLDLVSVSAFRKYRADSRKASNLRPDTTSGRSCAFGVRYYWLPGGGKSISGQDDF
jgi:hypothetical protein